MNSKLAFIAIIAIIVTALIVGFAVYYFTSNKDTFSGGIYGEYERDMESMRKSNDIGAPPGILKTRRTNKCDTKKTEMIQKHVTFKASRLNDGRCAYIDR